MKILIIGYGFVGRATALLNNKDTELFIYDINPDLCFPKNINLDIIVDSIDLVFISLPTPTDVDGSCYTNLIDEYIDRIKHKYIVVRSTVSIGYCDSKKVFFMPEFLTEKNWRNDFMNNKYWLFGIYEYCNIEIAEEFKNRITNLINLAYNDSCIKYNNILFGSNRELELNKIVRNTFLATKVSYFNEIYDLCKKLKVDYNNLIKFVKLDDRIGESHMQCPGYDNYRGYGGTCFPKDMNSLYYQQNKNNLDSYIIKASINRNENKDRIVKDWLRDVNRTNVENKLKINLITGGLGKVGIKLCDKLLEDPNNLVICLDIKKYNITKDNLYILNMDVREPIFLPKIDNIFHLTNLGSFDKYNLSPIEILDIFFNGTKNILELGKKHNAKILFISSNRTVESYINEHYANCNRITETLAYEYQNTYNLNIKILRYHNKSSIEGSKLIEIMK